MNRTPPIIRTVLACVVLAICGCTSYKAPKLTVVDVRRTEITDDAIVVRFLIDAQNLNDVEIPLRDATYSLSLDGRRVFEGKRSAQTTLHRNGTQRIELPVVIPIPRDGPAPTGIQKYVLTGRLVYVTPGEIAELLFDSNLRRPTVRFSDRGTVDFDTPPDPTPGTPTPSEPEVDDEDETAVPSIPEGG